jgi:hypothetical protein
MTPEMREEQKRRNESTRQAIFKRIEEKNDVFQNKLNEEFEYILNWYGVENKYFQRDTLITASILLEQRKISTQLEDIKNLLERMLG